MNKKAVLAGLGSGVIAGVLLAFVALNIAAPVATNDLGASVGVKLVIEVHRASGETEKYVKEGDLILKNFAALLVKIFAGYSDPDNEDDLIMRNGGSITDYIGAYEGSSNNFGVGKVGKILLGSGTTSPTINDYNITNLVVEIDVQDADITVNGTDMTIDIFASYTFDTNVTISEIGLAYYPYRYDGHTEYEVLLFRDVLQTPISLNAGDGITVHYYITLDNP